MVQQEYAKVASHHLYWPIFDSGAGHAHFDDKVYDAVGRDGFVGDVQWGRGEQLGGVCNGGWQRDGADSNNDTPVPEIYRSGGID